MTKFCLDDKVAIVTGSSRGIGKEIAIALAKNGAHVVVTSRSYERALKVTEEIIKQGGRAMSCSFDLEDHRSGKLLLETVSKQFNRIDILVNNAISRDSISPCPFSKLQYENLAFGMTTNLTNTIHLTSQAYPYLKTTKGIIINIGSVIVNRHMAGLLLYSVIKGAITQLTKGLASEWADDGIRVNQINPGFIETDSMVQRYPEKILQDYKTKLQLYHPLGRIGKSREIADLAVYMVSDEARWMTGTVVDIDGGYSNQRIPFPLQQEKQT
ncbi:3-oxoacyl-[acyl-carrier protein] reductase [Candidatus Electrothrix aarhusensis]|jgi:NAD(P)-dependent dehydrogenase (short-subunit alcohol dehydrogenase family)|uniref:3-oxoacyl-[acyl-carrier protein] reductase n=1 Tax=Candidatus Electrothrix aarhusensis TaxID=1859131 RepID=A0A3S3QJQ4_9BACT|nr:3-oxoacyl-[acyl-carrier protein] reductase [Candidatus Electrothrix aarhusensis]